MATIDDIYKLVVENRNALNEIIANAKATGDLDPATPLSGTELIRIVQNGVSKWTSTDDLKALGGVGEDNVQSDWAQTDNLLDDYIKNKPINLSDFNDDLGYSSPVWGAITGTLSSQTDLQTALNEKAPTSHTHIIDNVTGLQTALDGKISSIVAGTNITVDITDPENPIVSSTLTFPAVDWGNIEGTLSDQTDLQSALDSKASTSHTHTIAQVVNLQTTLDGKASTTHTHSTYDRASSVLSGANVFSNIVVTDGIVTSISTRSLTASDVGAADQSHGHVIANITGLQTALDSKLDSVVAGTNITVDNTDPNNPIINSTATGGASNWGDLGGTLSDQTDLQSALDAKLNIFESALSKTDNYSTANNNTEASKLLIFEPTGAPHTVTLSDTGLTIGFEQQVFNNSGQDITFTSSETINGSNIALANGYFAYYKLVAANEWVIAVGGSGGIGGGAVDSVNGQTGAVVLDNTDVGAAATSHTHIISDTTGLQAALDDKVNALTPSFIQSLDIYGVGANASNQFSIRKLNGIDTNTQWSIFPSGGSIEIDACVENGRMKIGNETYATIFNSDINIDGKVISGGSYYTPLTIAEIDAATSLIVPSKEWVSAQLTPLDQLPEFARRPLVSTLSGATETINPHVAYDQYLLKCSNAAGMAITLNADGNFDGNEIKSITFIQDGVGQLTFVDGTVTIRTAETKKTRKQYSMVTAIWTSTNEVYLTGDLELL